MENMIYNLPNKQCQIDEFVAEETLLDLIKKNLKDQFSEFGCIRIESNKGNGSSYLLNVITNEIKKNGKKCIFLNFKEGDKFSDLTNYHLQNIDLSPYVFINNIHFILGDKNEELQLVNFISQLAQNNVKLFYSTIREESIENKIMIEKSFTNHTLGLILNPLSTELKYHWASILLDKSSLSKIPKEIFEVNQSNADFLNSIQPYINEHKFNLGLNFDEIRSQKEQLKELENRFYRIKVNLLELQSLKSEAVRNQHYEKAADIREEEKNLELEMSDLTKSLDEIVISPKASIEGMELFMLYHRLLNLTKADENSKQQSIDFIKNKIFELKNQFSSVENSTNQPIINEIENWKYTLTRFTK